MNCVRLIIQDALFWVVHIPFGNMVKFQFLAQFTVDHLSYPVLPGFYSLCVNFLHSLIMLSIVSFFSPHNPQLLFCCVLSIFALIQLVYMVMFWLVGWLFSFTAYQPFSGCFNAELNIKIVQLNDETVLFQTIPFRISTQFQCEKNIYFKLFSLAYVPNLVLFKNKSFQTIQLSISTQFSFI